MSTKTFFRGCMVTVMMTITAICTFSTFGFASVVTSVVG